MIKKIFILFICVLSINAINAQSKTDVEDVFKMQLFLNKKNSIFRNMNHSVIKNDSLYNIFKNLIDLKIDTLQVENNLEGILYDIDYKFYKVSDARTSFNRKFINDDFRYLNISFGMDNFFILAVHQKTGASYRLAGFDTNDFLGFLSDFKEKYNHQNMKNLKTTTFLNNYKVQDLDFKCMYKGLRSKEIDRNKYPCLERCNDPVSMHQFSTK
ncbi:hypothetical protein [Flavobacterium sp. '19STA2R22 D10 B1']|uniref:hypothetical protein n=1 Tax=Flavobacterium aerium TaxID=3037261 RepID=UPI00278BE189|nr:hypothetical protein [Flavobacterium sp. '19STA2R22 D10 B1']